MIRRRGGIVKLNDSNVGEGEISLSRFALMLWVLELLLLPLAAVLLPVNPRAGLISVLIMLELGRWKSFCWALIVAFFSFSKRCSSWRTRSDNVLISWSLRSRCDRNASRSASRWPSMAKIFSSLGVNGFLFGPSWAAVEGEMDEGNETEDEATEFRSRSAEGVGAADLFILKTPTPGGNDLNALSSLCNALFSSLSFASSELAVSIVLCSFASCRVFSALRSLISCSLSFKRDWSWETWALSALFSCSLPWIKLCTLLSCSASWVSSVFNCRTWCDNSFSCACLLSWSNTSLSEISNSSFCKSSSFSASFWEICWASRRSALAAAWRSANNWDCSKWVFFKIEWSLSSVSKESFASKRSCCCFATCDSRSTTLYNRLVED